MTRQERIYALSKEELQALIDECSSFGEAAIKVANSRVFSSLVAQRARAMGVDDSGILWRSYHKGSKIREKKRSSLLSRIQARDARELQAVVDRCDSYSELYVALNIYPSYGKRAQELLTSKGVSLEELNRRSKSKRCIVVRNEEQFWKKAEEVFRKDSGASPQSARRLFAHGCRKYGLRDYKCEKCGNTGEWEGRSLSLEVDHKNGNINDNRLENLRWLCPNCHSQTATFRGKNWKKRGPGQVRTDDIPIKSQELYQLSYRPTKKYRKDGEPTGTRTQDLPSRKGLL